MSHFPEGTSGDIFTHFFLFFISLWLTDFFRERKKRAAIAALKIMHLH